ncbi:MAG: nuclease-related domain-containing protein [Burkholderiales bacterium]|nr:nuclease-related domain-containing protein [Burkholderiales bacterium]
MLLKQADDKSKRLTLLEDLQKSPLLDARQKRWLREELSRTRKGIQGERDSAYYLDQYFKDGENHVLLHDLRFEFDGDVAQIDHLIINRLGFMYLVETKNYAGNVSINSHGEFTVDYDGDCFGVASPIEQSHRHERILRKLLERLEITNRTGSAFDCHHVVMFHPKAIIKRPATAEFDTTNVIKADQFPSWHAKFVDKATGLGVLLRAIANVRSLDTAKEWGEKLMRHHRPASPLTLPDFMGPGPTRAGAHTERSNATEPRVQDPPVAEQARPLNEVGTKRLVCLHCQEKITYAEGKYCWNNGIRFKDGQYCRAHQALF